MSREKYRAAFDSALERYKLALPPIEEEQLRGRFCRNAAFDQLERHNGVDELQWAADIFVNAVAAYREVIGLK